MYSNRKEGDLKTKEYTKIKRRLQTLKELEDNLSFLLGITKQLTRIGVISVHRGWFLHKILWTKILGVVVKLTSLVSEIVVHALASWLGSTGAVASNQMICSE